MFLKKQDFSGFRIFWSLNNRVEVMMSGYRQTIGIRNSIQELCATRSENRECEFSRYPYGFFWNFYTKILREIQTKLYKNQFRIVGGDRYVATYEDTTFKFRFIIKNLFYTMFKKLCHHIVILSMFNNQRRIL